MAGIVAHDLKEFFLGDLGGHQLEIPCQGHVVLGFVLFSTQLPDRAPHGETAGGDITPIGIGDIVVIIIVIVVIIIVVVIIIIVIIIDGVIVIFRWIGVVVVIVVATTTVDEAKDHEDDCQNEKAGSKN
jgi:hypothetical protein